MANGIIGQIKPGGANGDKFNLRALNIYIFRPSQTLENGTASYPTTSGEIINLRNDDIVTLKDGMTISLTMPSGGQGHASQIQIYNSETNTVNTSPIKVIMPTGFEDFAYMVESRTYVLIYHESDNQFYVMNRHFKAGSITENDSNVVTGGAVYTYVNNLLNNRWNYIVCTSAANTPKGVTWTNSLNTLITGTLTASADTEFKIYLVPHTHTANTDVYDEWITIKSGSTYSWEKIGNTDVDISGMINKIANHTYTPAGTVTKPSFTGSSLTITSKNTAAVTTGNQSASSVTISTGTGATNYTPAGTVSGKMTLSGTATSNGDHTHIIKGTDIASTIKFTGDSSTTSTNSTPLTITSKTVEDSKDANYTPSGTIDVSKLGFNKGEAASNGSHTHTIQGTITGSLKGSSLTITSKNTAAVTTGNQSASSVTISTGTGATNYTPAGTVSKPNVTVTNGSVQEITSVGSASSYTVSNEILTLTASTAPTRATKTITAALAANPAFTGTGVQLVGTMTNHTHTIAAQGITVSGSGTPAGDITITNGLSLVANGSHTHSVTGNIGGTAAFTGTGVYLGGSASHSHTVTPLGSIATTGEEATATTSSAGAHTHNISGTAIMDTTNKLTFTGTGVQLVGMMTNHTHTIAAQGITVSGSGTPAGSVSQPTFKGTQATLSHASK